MWTLFKLARWAITGLVALWVVMMLVDGGLFQVIMFGAVWALPLALLWVLPAILRHKPPASKTHDSATFSADVAHDNIALDFKRDKLWIRDPVRGERYLDRNQVLNIRTLHDTLPYISRQRLEFQIRDVNQPLMEVFFQRHSDRSTASRNRNGQELDEWFARLRAWLKTAPVKSQAAQRPSDQGYTLPELHHAYGQAASDEARKNWLVSFDLGCQMKGLDARKEWEQLGGSYPGPSADLLRMQGA